PCLRASVVSPLRGVTKIDASGMPTAHSQDVLAQRANPGSKVGLDSAPVLRRQPPRERRCVSVAEIHEAAHDVADVVGDVFAPIAFQCAGERALGYAVTQ